MEIVFLSGLSGSGKTTALKALEDAGYFCIDNLPLELFRKFLDIINVSNSQLNKIAIVFDVREPGLVGEVSKLNKWLGGASYNFKFVFLKADKKVLIRRFEQTRRRHPLSIRKGLTLEKAIDAEIELLKGIEKLSDEVIDTTDLDVNQLRRTILLKFRKKQKDGLLIQLISFGFKYGLPIDVNNLWDVRFIDNPYFIDNLRDKTGLDEETYKYVMNQEKTKLFVETVRDFLLKLIPFYIEEGKSYLNLAFGCTGGKHRSVAIVEYFKEFLQNQGYNIEVLHRDIER